MITWENLFAVRPHLDSAKESSRLDRMEHFTCNCKIEFANNLRHCWDPGLTEQNFIPANMNHVITTLRGLNPVHNAIIWSKLKNQTGKAEAIDYKNILKKSALKVLWRAYYRQLKLKFTADFSATFFQICRKISFESIQQLPTTASGKKQRLDNRRKTNNDSCIFRF